MKLSEFGLKRTLIYYVLAPVICALLCMSAVFSSSKTLSVYANPTSEETIDFGTDGITVDDKTALNELITELGGTSYDDLSTKLGSGVKDASNFATAKTVTLGGVEFNITYVSKADYTANGTTAGDIIVTLWMAESEIKSQWNTVASDTPEDKYPTNMYSSSLIRSTLVGTPYLTEEGAETLEGTGEINDAWLPFNDGGAFYNYLATPANMAWQETLSAVVLSADEYNSVDVNYSNEAWGTPGGGSFAEDYDYSEKDGYTAWQHDRIWLPAVSEIANYGLWSTTAAQRSNTSDYWLRSGNNRRAQSSFDWTGNDNGNGAYLTFAIFAVRPAVHLNLKSAAEATKPFEVTVNDITTKYFTVEEAFSAANNAETAATVKMLADAEISQTLEVATEKNITLDLNGKMLKYNNGSVKNSVILVNGKFTLTDGEKDLPQGDKTPHMYSVNTDVLTKGLWIFDEENGTETLYGGVITGGYIFGNGGGVSVLSEATFTMEGGTIAGNYALYDGGVSVVGTFTMEGGTIEGNYAAGEGGGVSVLSEATFTMESGNICGNYAYGDGGGVFIYYGEFTMNRGTIASNYATQGGGVSINYGEFTMNSGNMRGNYAEVNGGGVAINYGEFTMNSGNICGNYAELNGGGVSVVGAFKVSGTPVITGNKVTIDGNEVENNVVLDESYKITVTGELTFGAKIGVNNTGEIATGFTQEGNPADFFIPDAPANNCIYLSGESNDTVNIGTHEYGEFTVETPATCTEAGSKSRHCAHCDSITEVTEIPALGHTLAHHEETAATKDEDGNIEYWSCEECENYFEDGNGERIIDDKSSVILPKLAPVAAPKAGIPWWVWLIVVFGVLAVGGAAVFVYFYIKKKKEDGNDDNGGNGGDGGVTVTVEADNSEVLERLDKQDEKIDKLIEIMDGGFNDIVDGDKKE